MHLSLRLLGGATARSLPKVEAATAVAVEALLALNRIIRAPADSAPPRPALGQQPASLSSREGPGYGQAGEAGLTAPEGDSWQEGRPAATAQPQGSAPQTAPFEARRRHRRRGAARLRASEYWSEHPGYGWPAQPQATRAEGTPRPWPAPKRNAHAAQIQDLLNLPRGRASRAAKCSTKRIQLV